MKTCLRCGQTYTDDTLNFCLNDGELLVEKSRYEPPPTQFADDSPPTLLMNQPRVTNPIDWAGSSPTRWQGQSAIPLAQYGTAGAGGSINQTLPMVALIMAIISLPMVCCAGGIWLGLPAAIVGFMGMRNAENDPGRYGGRGIAIGGMVLGIVTFLISLFLLIFGQLS